MMENLSNFATGGRVALWLAQVTMGRAATHSVGLKKGIDETDRLTASGRGKRNAQGAGLPQAEYTFGERETLTKGFNLAFPSLVFS